MEKYNTEREGQIDFFKNYGIPYDEDSSILIDNTDGVYNGILLEFKLNIGNLNAVLFQAIKYLSRMRVKGESVPKTILLIDLNDRKAYKYDSFKFLVDIEKEYVGAASKNNSGFIGSDPEETFNYDDMLESSNLKKLLKNKKTIEEMYVSINIDESCIVGWAERFYRENPTAKKGDFLGDDEGKVKITGEIREPRHFKGLINPYMEQTNVKFKYLMDCLNDRLQKKDLGAFYTPAPYAKKAAELVEMAVNRAIDAGKKDYIVLDRCGGCGALEEPLIGLYDKNGDEIISHAVISTYEYYEYKVLSERLGGKVRDIIPPTESDVVYSNGLIDNADAMSEEYINNPIIKRYLEDEDCAVIMFENPPYRDQSQKNNKEDSKDSKRTDKNYIKSQMKVENKYGLAVNDILNLFVWSAWKYYLRDEVDAYVVFAPIKHWKRIGLSDKEFVKGFIFNRKHFHATADAISCILFNNKKEERETLTLEVWDINKNNEAFYIKNVKVKKSHEPMSKLFDKRKMKEDDYNTAINCNRDGTEALNRKIHFKPYYNENMIGYLRAESYGFDANSICLVRAGLYNGHGFYVRKDNYIQKLPLFVAKQFPFDEWYYKSLFDTTSDGGDVYTKDEEFLKMCLIYTCLSNQNKCLSFTGSDGRYYKNELCFDTDTLASKDLKKYTLNEDEEELIKLWERILKKAKLTTKYNPKYSYGVYQIDKELNTFTVDSSYKAKKKVYDYPDLNGDLVTLRTKLKEYYNKHIREKMFKYELVK